MQSDKIFTESVAARISQELKRQLEEDARRAKRSVGQHLAWIIEQHFEQRGGEPAPQPQTPPKDPPVQQFLTGKQFLDEVFPGFAEWQKQQKA